MEAVKSHPPAQIPRPDDRLRELDLVTKRWWIRTKETQRDDIFDFVYI